MRGFYCFALFLFVLLRGELASAELVAHGLWNGYLAQDNIIECVNSQLSSAELEVELLGSVGERLYLERATLGAQSTRHFILPRPIVSDRYGTYFVKLVNLADAESIHCFTAIYRRSPYGGLEYAYSLAPIEAQSGVVAGTFNSMNPAGGPTPTLNWLSLVNLSNRELRGQIEVRSSDVREAPRVIGFTISLGGRRDFALGHPLGQQVGMYRILPADPQQQFAAQLMRYGTDGTNYRFAFPLEAQKGNCDSGAIALSTMGPATDWLEVGNVTATSVRASVELRRVDGSLIEVRSMLLEPFEQRHLHINPLLGDLRIGSARVRCDSGGVVAQSMLYGIGDERQVRWAYASTSSVGKAEQSCSTVFPTNTYLGAANWIKAISQESGERVQVVLHGARGELVASRSVGDIPKLGELDIPAHEISGTDFTGGVTVTPGADRSLALSMVRVFPAGAAIGTIMAVPGFARSCPEALAPELQAAPDSWGELLTHRELRRTSAERESSDDVSFTLTDYQGGPIDLVVHAPRNPNNGVEVVVAAPGAPGYSAFTAIAAAVGEARRLGASLLRFPPGEYRIETGTAKQHVDLSNLHDLTIQGEGAVLVFTNPRRTGLLLRDSTRVKLSGLTLDWEYRNSVAVDVVETASGKQLQVVGGEAIAPEEYDALYTFDYETRSWQAYSDGQRALFKNGAVLSEIAPGVYTHRLLSAITPGRRGVLMRTRVSKAVTVMIGGVRSEDITLSHVRFWNTPQMSVYATGVRGIRIADCIVEHSRRAPQLISGRADGFHIGGVKGDIVIENNIVEGQGDDGINIRGIDFEVSAVVASEGQIIVETNIAKATNGPHELDSFESGDLVTLMGGQQTPLFLGRVEKVTRLAATKLELTFRKSAFQDLAQALSHVQSGMRGFNLSKASSRFLIRNNVFRNNAGRGMLLSAPNGVVSENDVQYSRFSGMLVAIFNGAFFDGPGPSNVALLRNYIAHTNNVGGERDKPAGAISVYVEERNGVASFPLLQRLVIADNLIEDVQGLAIQLSHARNAKLIRNTVDHANTRPFRPPGPNDTSIPRGSLMVERSCHAQIRGNVRDRSSGELFVDPQSTCSIDAQGDY